jgi:hypothetical protein
MSRLYQLSDICACVCACVRVRVCVCEICVSNVVWVNAGQESKQALVNALYIQ